jgi:MoaA/NifB/PqqE/SkfB family radical SAM enzyme
VKGRSAATDKKLDDILYFLKEYRDKGFSSVNLHGGEPTIFQEFSYLINAINELGYNDITIQTNGVRLSDEKFVKSLIERHVNLFVVSMHDCIPAMHNNVTNSPDSFELVSKGIKIVLRNEGNVRTNTVLLKSNYQHIENIMDYLYDLGVRVFNISSLNPTWATPTKNIKLFEQTVPTYEELAPYLKNMLIKYSGKDVKITLEGFPYCFLPEFNHLNLYNTERNIFMLSYGDKSVINYEKYLNEIKIRGKAEKCIKCAMNNICKGVWIGYARMRGWDEFNPIFH